MYKFQPGLLSKAVCIGFDGLYSEINGRHREQIYWKNLNFDVVVLDCVVIILSGYNFLTPQYYVLVLYNFINYRVGFA